MISSLVAFVAILPLLPLPAALHDLTAPFALLFGMALALFSGATVPTWLKPWTRTLLQASIVGLGATLELGKVIEEGRDGFGLAVLSIASVFAIAWIGGRLLKVQGPIRTLIAVGTAICGGSAIAALSSTIDAPEEETAVSLGTIFLLNAAALILFPPLGHLFGLSQIEFGRWAGIAIHDVASVVGAGAAYGPEALTTATTVKLTRVLFLIPIVFGAALIARRGGGKVQWPWFILFFLLASAFRTYVPGAAEIAPWLRQIAGMGFHVALFATGLGLSRKALRAIGLRPLALGLLLWMSISAIALIAVRKG